MVLTQYDWCPQKEEVRTQIHTGHMRTQRQDGHQLGKEKRLKRNNPGDLDLELSASRTGRPYVPVVWANQSGI